MHAVVGLSQDDWADQVGACSTLPEVTLCMPASEAISILSNYVSRIQGMELLTLSTHGLWCVSLSFSETMTMMLY